MELPNIFGTAYLCLLGLNGSIASAIIWVCWHLQSRWYIADAALVLLVFNALRFFTFLDSQMQDKKPAQCCCASKASFTNTTLTFVVLHPIQIFGQGVHSFLPPFAQIALWAAETVAGNVAHRNSSASSCFLKCRCTASCSFPILSNSFKWMQSLMWQANNALHFSTSACVPYSCPSQRHQGTASIWILLH